MCAEAHRDKITHVQHPELEEITFSEVRSKEVDPFCVESPSSTNNVIRKVVNASAFMAANKVVGVGAQCDHKADGELEKSGISISKVEVGGGNASVVESGHCGES